MRICKLDAANERYTECMHVHIRRRMYHDTPQCSKNKFVWAQPYACTRLCGWQKLSTWTNISLCNPCKSSCSLVIEESIRCTYLPTATKTQHCNCISTSYATCLRAVVVMWTCRLHDIWACKQTRHIHQFTLLGMDANRPTYGWS